MASPAKRTSSTATLFTFLVIFICVCDAAVTWRRVRPTRPTPTSTAISRTESTTSTTTRSPITWKRSTLPRKSTTAVQRRDVRAQEAEVDNEQAEAREDLAVVKDEEPVIKPLAPGSRPGFWFDSARRRRPAIRKNSLFPAKPSPGTTPVPQTETVTSTTELPLTTTPLPAPKVDEKNSAINSKTRLFGRNRSTKTPITFRKRIRTTSTPTSTTTEIPEVEVQLNVNIPSESVNDKEEEKQNNLEDEVDAPDTNNPDAKDTSKQTSIRRPGFGTKRRFRNSTRPLWSRESGRLKARTTTPTPVQTKTSTPVPLHQDTGLNYRTSTTSSRVRTRTKISRTTASPQTSWRKSHRTTERPEISIQRGTGKRRPQKNSFGTSTYTFERQEPNVAPETEFESVVTPDAIKDAGSLRGINRKRTSVVKTTVEPFYITRDYGRIATAFPDYYQKRKHSNIEVTTAPSTTIITTTEDQDITTLMEANSTPSEDIDASLEETETGNEEPVFDSTIKPTEMSNLSEFYGDKVSQDKAIPTKRPGMKFDVFQDLSTSTKRPVLKLDTFAPNPGANAYVVWSLGQGGSGWSYQKNGDQVKWSAQNSEAEGDRWSVEGKDRDTVPKQPLWVPLRNSSNQFAAKQIEKTFSIPSHGNKNVFKIKENLGEPVEPVTYIPNIPYRNETIVNIKSTSAIIPPSENIQFPEFPPGVSDFTPLISQNSSELTKSQKVSDEQTVADGESLDIAEQPTLIPAPPTNASIESTLDNEYAQHLFEIQEKELQSQFSPNYPYIAEIRDTFNNFVVPSTNNPANAFEVQEYITETPASDISGHSYPLSPTLPSPQIQYFIQDFGENIPSTLLPELGIDASIPESFPDLAAGPDTYLDPHFDGETSIPPELAKAVVEAKKWNVVGDGGEDGWSLLGEDGRLEWKIHNVNGQWRVTSADQLINANAPDMPPPGEILINNDQSANRNSEEFKEDVQQKKPTVWTLDDDYDKWKTVSAERRVPGDESSAEKWSPTDKLQYGKNPGLRGDYYSNDDYSYGVTDGVYKTYSSQEAFADRPFWGTGENKMVKSDSSDRVETYPRFKGTVEVANTKKEAIEAWKSLLAEHGNWKLSEKPSRINKGSGLSNFEDRREYDSHIDDKTSDNESSTEREVEKAKSNKQKSSSVPKQSEHSTINSFKSDHKHHRHYPEDYLIAKNAQKGKSSVKYQEQVDSSEHLKTNDDLEKRRRKYNGNFETNVRDVGFNNEQPYETDFNFDNEGTQRDSNNYKNEKIDNGPVQEPSGIKIATKSASKVDSLINKLETIQKESKGRAVMDLSELLKLIKANRNASISKAQTKAQTDDIDMARQQEHFRSRNKHIRHERIRNFSKMTPNPNRPDYRDDYTPKEFSQDKRFDRYETSSEEEFTPYNYNNGGDKKLYNSEPKPNLYEVSTDNDRQFRTNPKSGKNSGSVRTTSQRRNRLKQNTRPMDASEVTRNRYVRPKIIEKVRTDDYIPEVIERRYTIPQDRRTDTSYNSQKRLQNRPKAKTYDPTSSEEQVNFREKQNYLSDDAHFQNHRSNRKGTHRSHHHSPPIVLSGETDVEDGEDGSKKSRKIIVIDYAGKQKNSPIERKDLELIIRNVKHRRSKLLKDSSEEEPEK